MGISGRQVDSLRRLCLEPEVKARVKGKTGKEGSSPFPTVAIH